MKDDTAGDNVNTVVNIGDNPSGGGGSDVAAAAAAAAADAGGSSSGGASGNQSSSFAAFSDSTYGTNANVSSAKSFILASFAAAQRQSFSILTTPQPVLLSLVVSLLELFQVVLVPVALLVSLSPDSSWNEWANIVRYPFDPTPQHDSHYAAAIAIAWALAGFSAFYWAVWWFEWLFTRNGSLPHLRIIKFLRMLCAVTRLLPMPVICISIALLRCSEGAAGDEMTTNSYTLSGNTTIINSSKQCFINTAHSVAVSIVGLIFCTWNSLWSSAFQVDFLPSLDKMAQTHSRPTLLLFCAKIALALLTLLHPVNAVLQSLLILAVFAAVALVYAVLLPYFKNIFNLLYVGALSFGLWAALWAFIASIVYRADALTESVTAGLLGVQLIGGAIFGLAMVIAVRMRLKWLDKKLKSGTSSIRYPFDLALLHRACYNCKPFPNIVLNERAIDMLARFNEKFPTSAFVHMAGAIFALECHDPRAMIVQAKNGKRQDTYPDTKYLLNCMIQYGHDVLDEEAGGKREIEQLLDSAARHQKLAKSLITKFWSNLAKNNEVDNGETWDLMRTIHDHDNKAYNILMGLLRKYPTNIRILRQYARFMDEVRNDKEASSRAFMLADQYEEDSNSKNKKKHGKNKLAVKLAPMTPDHQGQDGTVAAVSPKGDETGTQSQADDETKSDSLSISSASGLQQSGDDMVKTRSYRRRFESAKSYAALRLNAFFLLAIATIWALILAEYIAATSALSKFNTHLNVVNSSSGTRLNFCSGINFARIRERDPVYGSCATILLKADMCETQLTAMFKQSKITSSIADIWSKGDTTIRYYVPGPNPGNVSSGAFYTDSTKPLWDASLTIINAWHSLCNQDDSWYSSTLPLRFSPHFRILLDNLWSVADHFTAIGQQFGHMINSDVSDVKWISLALFVARFGVAIFGFLLLFVWAFRSITLEHRAATIFFKDIPRSTISNITEKLSSGATDDLESHELTVNRKSLSSTTLSVIQVALSFLVLLGIGAAMFSLIIVFCTKYSTAGTLINTEGDRRFLIGATVFSAQEFAAKDPYGDPSNTTYWRLNTTLTQLKEIDESLKYGDTEDGLTDYLRTDERLFYLWYSAPCPDALNLSACFGLGQLLRRYIDEVNMFYGADPADSGLNNTNFVRLLKYGPYVATWLEQGLSLLFTGISDASTSLETSLKVVFSIACVLTVFMAVGIRFTVNRVAHETERLLKMLIFVPVSDLESISSIKDYIESDTDITKVTKAENSHTQEQQTKNMLDGCEDAVLVCGPLLTMEIVNPAAEKLTGFVAQDLLGQPITTVVPEEIGKNSKFVKRLKKNTSAAYEAEKERKAREITLQTKTGHRIQALVTISRSTVNNRTSQALFIRDITPQKEHEKKLLQQQKLAEQFLSNIIPKTLVKQLADRQASGGNMIIAEKFEEVSVMFADIVQFTNMSSGMTPEAVVRVLNDLVSQWDKLALELGVEKIKTIGDCYMACTGVPIAFADHADVMMDFVIGMQKILADWNAAHPQGPQVRLRIGVHTGSVVAGVLGIHKMAYDLWGETVATAERMESSSFPDRVQLSETTYRKVKGHGWHFESRGKVQVKNRGEIEGYLYVPDAEKDRVQSPDSVSTVSKSRESLATPMTAVSAVTTTAPKTRSSLATHVASLDNINPAEFDDLPSEAGSPTANNHPSIDAIASGSASVGSVMTGANSTAGAAAATGTLPTDRVSTVSMRSRHTGPTALGTPRQVEEEIGPCISESIPQLLGTLANEPEATDNTGGDSTQATTNN